MKKIGLDIDNLIIALLSSAVIGVAISYSDLYLFHFLLGCLFITWLYTLKENRYQFNFNAISENYIFFLFIMFIWYLFSLFWAQDTQLALKYIFYIFCGLIITLNIVGFSFSIDRLNKIFKILSFFFVLQLIIALFESFTIFRMPISSYSSFSSYFGKEEMDSFASNNILLTTSFVPPTGFHWNTNNLGIAMLITLPFFLCTNRMIYKLFGVISITAITIMTASRAVFLGLIIIYCLYLIIIKKRIGTLLFIWITTISLFWGMNQLSDSENPRVNEVANTIKALTLYIQGDIDIGGSISWRRELVDNGLEGLSKTYGLGLGAGGSTANQEQIGPVAGQFTSMHNFWIELLVEGGIIFALSGLLWYGSIVYNLFIIFKTNTNSIFKYYSESLFLSMISFIPAAIAASSTIYFFPMWIMFGMAISVISLYKKQSVVGFKKN
tara:strand:- start:1772 stop:3088 length:1317 start_codon:yes stop_codon:yes gene_type:complete